VAVDPLLSSCLLRIAFDRQPYEVLAVGTTAELSPRSCRPSIAGAGADRYVLVLA